MSNLQTLCNEFALAFEAAIDELHVALEILEEIDRTKAERYRQSGARGFHTSLNARSAGPDPWASIRQSDNRLSQLLKTWEAMTSHRGGHYAVPDVFGPPPVSELEREVEKPVSRGRLALDKMAGFFNRGANP